MKRFFHILSVVALLAVAFGCKNAPKNDGQAVEGDDELTYDYTYRYTGEIDGDIPVTMWFVLRSDDAVAGEMLFTAIDEAKFIRGNIDREGDRPCLRIKLFEGQDEENHICSLVGEWYGGGRMGGSFWDFDGNESAFEVEDTGGEEGCTAPYNPFKDNVFENRSYIYE